MTTDNPTTSEMVERLCRKAASVGDISYRGYGDGGPPTVYIGHGNEWRNWEWIVRLLLSEMREPTEAMIKEGMDANDLLTKDQVLPAYQAMIDAALGE